MRFLGVPAVIFRQGVCMFSVSDITPPAPVIPGESKAARSRVLGGCVALGWVEVLLASTSGADGFCQQCSCLSHKGTPE